MLLKQGKNRIRDLMDDDKYKGQLGTGTDPPTEDDTGLQTPVAATLKTLTSSVSTKQLVLTYALLSTEGNGNTYTEYENQLNSGTDHLNRVVFTGIAKDNTKEFQINTIVNIP